MIGCRQLRRMRRAFRALPDTDRTIFVSVGVDDLSYTEAAACHGCTVQEVEQAIARVLVALGRAADDRR